MIYATAASDEPQPTAISSHLTLTVEDDECIRRIWNLSDAIYEEAKKLGESLAGNETFKRRYGDPPKYEAVKNDPLLKEYLTYKIELCLPRTFASSKYGVVEKPSFGRWEVATDYDLAQMDRRGLTQKCSTIDAPTKVFQAVAARMTTLKRRISLLVHTIINAFGFEGTPVESSNIQSPEQMQKASEDAFRTLTVRFSVSFLIYN